MSVPVHAIHPGALRLADDAGVPEWLDALAAAECTQDQFIGEILGREHDDPDVGWEALALLDRQFRCQKISQKDFDSLKARLHRHFLRPGQDAPQSAPHTPESVDAQAAGTALVDAPFHSGLRPGDRFCERYRVVEVLRRTSAGTLVEAIDETKIELPSARRRVAIQVVDEILARDPAFLSRIGKLQNLSHPALAKLVDVERHGEVLLLVTELTGGASLHNLLARNDGTLLHVALAQAALRAAAQALVHAHAQGIAHGDVSAGNIFLTQTGKFRLQGFETHDPRHPADFTGDRTAFSALAYKLLTGPHDSRHGPVGATRDQLHALRNQGDVLAVFARSTPELPQRPSAFSGWSTAAGIATVLGISAYLYAGAGRETQSTGNAVVAPAPVAEAPAAAFAPTPADTAMQTLPSSTALLPDVPIPAAEPAADPPVTAPARPRIDLPIKADIVETTAPVARIWVRRRGNLDEAISFTWWTESGSAEVDRDFRAVAPRVATIPGGAKGIELLVPLMPDVERREPRTFYVKIDNPRPRATLGAASLMQIAIVPPGYPAQRSNSP